MQISINFKDESIAQKVLWLLERFKDDGVEIIKIDDSDSEIIDNFKEGLEELDLIKMGKIKPKEVDISKDRINNIKKMINF